MMAMKVIHGCTECDIANTSGRDLYNDTLTNYVFASQIQPYFTYENVFMGLFHSIQFKNSI